MVKEKEVSLDFIDKEKFLQYLENLPKQIRVNTLKISADDFERITQLPIKKIYREAYEITDAFLSPGKTMEYMLGYIHPQMFTSTLVSYIVDPRPGEFVLDATAAPGGKTTHLSALMKNRGVIIAVDRTREKMNALFSNIARLGATNVIAITFDSKKIKFNIQFDKILVDAPCSNLGSRINAWKRFRSKDVWKLRRIQRKILRNVFRYLKVGGYLVYSTCTITREENEGVIYSLLNEFENAKLVNVELEFPHEHGFDDLSKELRKAIRIYPWHVNSEAFFIAKIRKEYEI